MTTPVQIRRLEPGDPEVISSAFATVDWHKPVSQYRRYLAEQEAGDRVCYVARVRDEFAGYVTINWNPDYPGSIECGHPEIQDLNVLPRFQRQGVGSCLLDHAEREVSGRFCEVGIAVGLHPGYNRAQRLYVKRGYVPDGRGLTYANRYVREGERVPLDDDLVLHFTKSLRSGLRQTASGSNSREAREFTDR
jgi:GNAT superfamily N-acetyltransferase